MKRKIWKYLTVIFSIVGVALMVFSFSSAATTIPMERSLAAIPTGYSGTVELKNMGEINRLSIPFAGGLDQSQEKMTVGYYVGVIMPDGGCYCQTVKNERKPMNGFLVAIGKHGTPSEPIYIGVMSSKKDPTSGASYHIVTSLDASNFPEDDMLYWCGGDFSSKPLDGYLCFIVAISTDDPSDGNYWMWGAGDGDPYKPWVKDHWHWNDEKWVAIYGDDEDMCFRTFTEGNGNGEPLTITITSTYQVISQFLGSLSLLGAVISGTKYFLVV